MDWDDVKARPAKAITPGEDLSTLSITELGARVAALETEIARINTEIARKKAHESAASALFKKG